MPLLSKSRIVPRPVVLVTAFLATRIFRKWKLPVLESFRRGYDKTTKDRENQYPKLAPPDTITVELRTIRLYKMVRHEHYDELKEWMTRVFPELRDDSNTALREMDVERQQVGVRSWRRVGSAVRSKEGILCPDRCAEIPSLPSDVASVEVTLFRPAPSFYIIALDVLLEKSSWQNAVAALRRAPEVKPQFYIEGPLWKPRRFTTIFPDVLDTARRKVSEEVARLRKEVECVLNLDFEVAKGLPLSWVEIYYISGIGRSFQDLQAWLRSYPAWAQSFNFSLLYTGRYRNGLMWTWPSPDHEDRGRSQVLMFPEIAHVDVSNFFSPESAFQYHISELLDATALPAVLAAYLNQVETQIADLYGTIGSATARNNLREISRQHQAARELSLWLEQVTFDIAEQLPGLEASLNAEGKFQSIIVGVTEELHEVGTIFRTLLDYAKNLSARALFLRKTNLDYLQTRSIESNEVLMRRTVAFGALAVLTSFLTIWVTLATNWSSAKAFLQDVSEALHRPTAQAHISPPQRKPTQKRGVPATSDDPSKSTQH